MLQSIAQQTARYGEAVADAMQGGFNPAITYQGSDPETCLFFEGLAGTVRGRQKDFPTATTNTYHEFNPLNASDIRTPQPGGTLVVSTNRNPVLIDAEGNLRTLPFHLASEKPGLSGLDGFFAARLVRAA